MKAVKIEKTRRINPSPSDNDFASFDGLLFTTTQNFGNMGCTEKCRSRKCIRKTEKCLDAGKYGTFCIRHCPCKQKIGGTKKARTKAKDKENCDNCDPSRARCHVCQRCSRCCGILGKCNFKTPPPKRSNREATLANLKEAVVADGKTPLVTKLLNGELELRNESQETRLFETLGVEKSLYHSLPQESIRHQINCNRKD